MPSFFCCNPLCPEKNSFPNIDCPSCGYRIFVHGKYKPIKDPLNKNPDKFTIKVKDESSDKTYLLKIIKQPNNVGNTYGDINDFKNKFKGKKYTADLIDIFEVEYTISINGQNLQSKYDCIIFEFIEGLTIEARKNTIKKKYKKEFLGLLKSLNSLHQLGIIHGKITSSNILYHDKSWKIVDIYPKKYNISQEEGERKDLIDLTTIYKNLFKNDGYDPYYDRKNKLVVERVINNILGDRLKTTEDAIRELENKIVYYFKIIGNLLWTSLLNVVKFIKDLDSSIKTTLLLGTAIFFVVFSLNRWVTTGTDPITFWMNIKNFGHTETTNPEKNPQVSSTGKPKITTLSEQEFESYLKEVKLSLDKRDLIDADVKTRELMLKVFSDRGDKQSNSKVLGDTIQINFEKSQNSNGLTSVGDNQIISSIQKGRVQAIDRVWFDGTKGKHGFYQQQTVYGKSTSDPNCRGKNDHERETSHVDATFKNLGWGSRGCKKIAPIPTQIDEIMMSSESWDRKRQRIQAKFKENGGVSDNENVPDGYYPITAGLVANQQFPQFAQWCGYTKEDLEAKQNTN